MRKKIMSVAFTLLLSSYAIGQHYHQGETVYPVADAIRDQINKDRQKYTNVKLSEEAEVPIILNGKPVFMDTLRTIPLKNVLSITLNFDNNKYFYFGSIRDFGVIVVTTKEEDEK